MSGAPIDPQDGLLFWPSGAPGVLEGSCLCERRVIKGRTLIESIIELQKRVDILTEEQLHIERLIQINSSNEKLDGVIDNFRNDSAKEWRSTARTMRNCTYSLYFFTLVILPLLFYIASR